MLRHLADIHVANKALITTSELSWTPSGRNRNKLIEGKNSGRSSLQVSIQKIIRIEFEIELERKRKNHSNKQTKIC